MKRIAPVVALVVLLVPAAAQAKGANVRISSAPNGTEPGEPWFTRVTVTTPGNGRLGGIRPHVIIRRGAQRRSFPLFPTSRRGIFTMRVVFPSRGPWRYGVYDDFNEIVRGGGRVHWFPEVMIAAGQPKLAKPPRPISGDVRSHATYVAPHTQDDSSEDDGGSGAMFPALAFLLAAAVAGPVWVGRHRNNKRATMTAAL